MKYKDITFEHIPQYISDEDCKRLLGKRRYKRLQDFLTGSTSPVVEGRFMLYPRDVENFFKHEAGKPYLWD